MKKSFLELGRSMVEMLGVLAIIGVLSVVGIQGYKKAMNKIKANEAMSAAMKAYNEAIARTTIKTPTGQSQAIWGSAIPNLGLEPFSWKSDANMRLVLWNDANRTFDQQTYHVIYFLYLGNGENDCGVCDAIKDMTLPKGTSKSIRILPGSQSQTGVLSNGIWIGCHYGAYSDATSCWK